MATIKPRKSKFSVIYWYVNEDGERKQKWDTLDTKQEAKTRKAFVEYYQQVHGSVIVPLQEQYAREIQEAKESVSELDSSTNIGDITFKEFLEIFVNLYGASKWSVTTYSHKIGTINNYINPFIGDLKLTEITTKRLSLYYNELLNVPEVPHCNGKPSRRCTACKYQKNSRYYSLCIEPSNSLGIS